MKTLLVLLISLLLAGVAEAQITCTQIGQFLSCDGPRGQNSIQSDLGNGMGVISGQSGYGEPSYMEPYAIIPSPTTTRPGSITAPRAPQAPAAPSLPYGLPDPLSAPEFQAPIFVPYSFGGEGQ